MARCFTYPTDLLGALSLISVYLLSSKDYHRRTYTSTFHRANLPKMIHITWQAVLSEQSNSEQIQRLARNERTVCNFRHRSRPNGGYIVGR